MPSLTGLRTTQPARPKVNRQFWQKLQSYCDGNAAKYQNNFGYCQLDLFREGAATAANSPEEFSRSRADHSTYGKPRQKTLSIPLSEEDHNALVPFYDGAYDVQNRDDVAVIMLSIGCRCRGLI